MCVCVCVCVIKGPYLMVMQMYSCPLIACIQSYYLCFLCVGIGFPLGAHNAHTVLTSRGSARGGGRPPLRGYLGLSHPGKVIRSCADPGIGWFKLAC